MQYNPITPKNSLQYLQICTPIGTEAVRLEGQEIVGRWQQSLRNFCGHKNRLLIEDFVNWGQGPTDIVRFTALYAPLRCPDNQPPPSGREFRFRIDEWRKTQELFQRVWESRTGRPSLTTTIGGSLPFSIVFIGDQLIFLAESLEFFMHLELITAPTKRLRKCALPGCATPYFVARHLRQQYCSPSCAGRAQAQWKKKWWDERGPEWRKQRNKQKRRKVQPNRAIAEKIPHRR